MTELPKINVCSLSEGQKRKLAKAYRDNEEVLTCIAHSALSGSDSLMVPMNTIKYCLKHEQQCFIGLKNTRRSRVFLNPIKHALRVF